MLLKIVQSLAKVDLPNIWYQFSSHDVRVSMMLVLPPMA